MVNTPDNAVFDRALLDMRKGRFTARAGEYDFLKRFAADIIEDRFADIKREFKVRKDIGHEDVRGEIEALGLEPQHYDLITSSLILHTINDLPGALVQIKRALKPDGLFMAAMFGGESLYELRESLMSAEIALKGGASPRVFPFADKQQAGALLQRAGFALPVIDSEIVTVSYENIFKLMHDLRGMGESNIIKARSRVNPGKAFFAKAAEHYQENFSEDDGRIIASFEIIFLLGWAPHDSQQKPLAPGSAKTRLADALSTDEIKTGDKP